MRETEKEQCGDTARIQCRSYGIDGRTRGNESCGTAWYIGQQTADFMFNVLCVIELGITTSLRTVVGRTKCSFFLSKSGS